MHHLVRVVRGRVLHHGDLVAQLGGVANSRFDAGVRDQPDDDELMGAVLLELQVQVGVGEAARTPVFLATISPGAGTNSARNSPPHVPYSKLLWCHVAR